MPAETAPNRRAVLAGLAALAAVPGPARAASASRLTGQLMQYQAQGQDTFVEIARWYNLGFVELVTANPGVDPWLPGEGRAILLPTAHLLPQVEGPARGIVINLGDQRLYLFEDGAVRTWPIGIGREGVDTPVGRTSIVQMRTDPTWIPTESMRAENPDLPAMVPPGPDNPMGAFAIDLGFAGAYRVHGTNRPYAVGRRVSSGCIRLYPEGIEDLFGRVTVGTPVTVVDQPWKLGLVDGRLLVEVHVEGAAIDAVEAGTARPATTLPGLTQAAARLAAEHGLALDAAALMKAIAERTGVPQVIA
ncbi:L,D-transpeptidase family protein [Zavarzinia sp. CC-PAN008]|uniref:L,D-transpeptidase family protein n=1 Tax=Zavarzinia sp. CC-PAN008 TaxID=3243332 RepID=UPI003F744B3E